MENICEYIVEAYNNAKRGDEFYTRYKDIEKELKNYSFSGKIVYCCCDDPALSNFYKYFFVNFKKLKLKKLLISFYGKESYILKYDGENSEKLDNIQNGDFTKQSKLFNECDIVVTNPPFSNDYPAKLIEICISMNKKFIIVAPLLAYTKKETFKLYKEGKFDLGYNSLNIFDGPNGKKNLQAACVWLTNFPIEKQKINLHKKYVEGSYKKYENYDAIDIKNEQDIPYDYNGNIGISVRFAQKLSRKQFDVVDAIRPIMDNKKIFMKLIIKNK